MAGNLRWKVAQFAERRWWKRYLSGKDVESYLKWKRDYWTKLNLTCQHYIQIKAGQRILDAGCGPAGMFMILPENKVVAIDPLLDVYELDLNHFKKSNYPWVEFRNIGIEEFKTDDGFDVVYCMNAINHVRDIGIGFDRLTEAIKNAGYIVVSIDAHTHSLFKRLFRLLPGDILHPHQYDLNEYQQMLTSRGFTLMGTELFKHTFLFDHYVLIAQKKSPLNV
jgi:2-polyprenyl-3-methyl-5-hydroxy-6-metoxy-1,4-benzoquinol methylase